MGYLNSLLTIFWDNTIKEHHYYSTNYPREKSTRKTYLLTFVFQIKACCSYTDIRVEMQTQLIRSTVQKSGCSGTWKTQPMWLLCYECTLKTQYSAAIWADLGRSYSQIIRITKVTDFKSTFVFYKNKQNGRVNSVVSKLLIQMTQNYYILASDLSKQGPLSIHLFRCKFQGSMIRIKLKWYSIKYLGKQCIPFQGYLVNGRRHTFTYYKRNIVKNDYNQLHLVYTV